MIILIYFRDIYNLSKKKSKLPKTEMDLVTDYQIP